MSDLKNQIFALLEKCPDHITTVIDDFIEATYYNGEFITYRVHVSFKPNPTVILFIYFNSSAYRKEISVTEKEFMDIKWKIEAWEKEVEAKALETFKEFAEKEPNSMDDLLND